ncbi:TPA: DUF551 domain-containing protein [Klebsiella pneumoniae subsp. pneumoniae]|nr:DUF551 domain-containing protein [Klebsiella pneumoniae subsp. pneumoniae]
MTKSTITRERLEQLADNNTICKVSWDERIELAQIALAAMDSEPVAEVYQAPNVGICATLGPSIRMLYPLEPGTKLYRHAQPVPVVMDDTKLRELFDSWFASDCSFDLSPEASEADNIAWRESYWYVWKRCRATILAAARQSPGSEPATVPGKWIPVSERMPEVGEIVLAAMGGAVIVSETECTATGLRFFTSVISGRELPATHWMPLPAVPQEVR